MNNELGKWLIILDLLIVLAGMIIWLIGDHLSWLGNLPGNIHIKNENFSFYFPITTMIIVSIVLSVLFTVLARVFGE